MSESDENRNPLLQGEKWILPHSSEDRVHADIAFSKEVSNKENLLPSRGDATNNNIISNNNNHSNNDHTIPDGYGAEYLDPEEQCGFPRCVVPPWWVQRLANKKTFLFVFCVSSVLQGMYYTYFVSVLTTIERLFQIRSQTTGVIMSATEVGQVGGGLLLSYYGGGGHRPRWIASGMLLFGFSAALCALPHFLFGDALLKEFLNTAPSLEDPLTTANVCLRDVETPAAILGTLHNATFEDGVNLPDLDDCKSTNPHSRIVLGLFFLALLGVGVGQTAVFNLGIPYIDDNVASEDSPTYFGTTIGVRIFGPTFGFVLGSLCTRLSVDPFSKAKFEPTDPRWIGAWWLGHLIISFSLILTSFVMMMFPKRLPVKDQTDSTRRERRLSNGNFDSLHSEPFEDHSPLTEETLSLDSSSYLKSTASNSRPSSVENIYDNRHIHSMKISSSTILTPPPITEEAREKVEFGAFKKSSTHDRWAPRERKRSIKDFMNVLRRLVTNRILVLRTGSTVLHLLPISGLYTFLPKYIETQFRLPVHSAAMISGVGGILVMGFGILASGFVIRRLNPPPRAIAAWIAITAFLYSVGMIILMFLGCSHDDVRGRVENQGSVSFEPICASNCSDCNTDLFAPICSSEGNTYFSACHAGCRTVSFINDTEEMLFSDCECLGDDVTANLRLCETLCPNIFWYVGVFCLFVIIHSTSEVGGMLVTLRCVSPSDKAMALGLISVAVGLFGNVPCPILYGAVVDYACIHWRQSCEGKGACQIYDPDVFRKLFHGTTAFVMFLGFCVDVAVWHCCKGVSFSNGNTDSNDTMDSSSSHSTFLRQTVPPPRDSLTVNCDDNLSTLSSTASSHRKHKNGNGNTEQTILRNSFDQNLDKDLVYDKDVKASSLQIPFDLTNYSLRESII